MAVAKIFKNGKSQAVRLPKEFRFDEGEEVIIKKLGKMIVIYPKKNEKDIFYSSLGKFDDDVFETIENVRKDYVYSVKEEL